MKLNKHSVHLYDDIASKIVYHPDHKTICKRVNYWRASFDTDEKYLDVLDTKGDAVLFRFPGESNDAFCTRKKITPTRNYTAGIVKKYRNVIMESQVDRPDEEWLMDVDGHGSNIKEFLGNTLLRAAVDGNYYVLPVIEGTEALNAAQESNSDRLIGVDVYDLINWRREGDYIVEALIKFYDENGNPYALYLDEVNYEVLFLEKDAIVDRSGLLPHNYGKIPLIEASTSDWAGGSMIASLADNQKHIVRHLSTLFVETGMNTFTRWVLTGFEPELDQNGKPTNLPNIHGPNKLHTASGDAVNLHTVGADVSQADSIRKTIEDEVTQLYVAYGIQPPDIKAGEAKSGVALELEAASANIIITDLLTQMQSIENEIYRLRGTVLDQPYIEVEWINYGINSEDVDSLLDRIEKAEARGMDTAALKIKVQRMLNK